MVFLQRQDPQNNAWASLVTAIVLFFCVYHVPWKFSGSVRNTGRVVLLYGISYLHGEIRHEWSQKVLCTLLYFVPPTPHFYSHAPRHKWKGHALSHTLSPFNQFLWDPDFNIYLPPPSPGPASMQAPSSPRHPGDLI